MLRVTEASTDRPVPEAVPVIVWRPSVDTVIGLGHDVALVHWNDTTTLVLFQPAALAVGVGVGEGVGPGVIVNRTRAELLACVPEISVKTIDPFQVPAGMPLMVNAQLPLDDLTECCSGVRLRPLSGAATNFTVPVTTGVPVGRFTST